jgi:hypothetical protein
LTTIALIDSDLIHNNSLCLIALDVKGKAMTLSKEFELLMATVATRNGPKIVDMYRLNDATKGRTSTVYSVAEALSQKGRKRNAKLGASSI